MTRSALSPIQFWLPSKETTRYQIGLELFHALDEQNISQEYSLKPLSRHIYEQLT